MATSNSIGEYKPGSPSIKQELDFDIKLKFNENDFVPLGIPNFKGDKENDSFIFDIIIEGKGVNQWHFIVWYKENVLYECFSGTGEIEEVVITAKSKKKTDRKNNQENLQKEDSRFWPAGIYELKWTGFDKNGIYDSAVITDVQGLSISIVGQADGKQKTYALENPLKFKYKEVDWVDVKIDKNNKKIDATLRVNLQDGGENGLKCDTGSTNAFEPSMTQTKCPWEKIPTSAIKPNQPILKTRTKKFTQLKNIAFMGLKKHWSRSSNNGLSLGNSVNINGEKYEIDVNPIDSNVNSMNSLPLVYNTNNSWMRSGNPGGSYNDGNLDDAAMNLFPDTGIIQRLSYNVGYIYEYFYTKNWDYQTDKDETIEFMYTAAHELGHELLQANGGTIYSWQHKGSSYYFPQDTKPTKGNETKLDKITHWDEMETDGEDYPINGEVDVMKYYNKEPRPKSIDRTVASEKDVLGLVWLTKLKLK